MVRYRAGKGEGKRITGERMSGENGDEIWKGDSTKFSDGAPGSAVRRDSGVQVTTMRQNQPVTTSGIIPETSRCRSHAC